MGQDIVVDLGRQMLWVTLMLIGPLIGTALVVGLLIGIFQAATSIQEQTLTFLPKLFAVLGVFVIAMPWFLQKIMSFTSALLKNLFAYTF
ncbi:MAG: flagellar biosynthesis protein FliQ [Candidatus Scalindua sp.]|nr:flagellar biosynthesis protein FliQ [Candidatus Scalindua sp.]